MPELTTNSIAILPRQLSPLPRNGSERDNDYESADRLLMDTNPPEPTAVAVSIVIPLLNEEDSLQELYDQLRQMMDSLDRSCEVILIDDGSSDGSFNLLRQLQQADPRLRAIKLRRNFGQTAAFSAGFDHARGDVIITMDADLQNDPRDIPKLLAKMDEGYDIVSGWRVDRQDKWLTRRVPSQAANWLISWLTGVKLHDYGCSLKAYRHEVLANTKLYGELHRFIPALASWMGVEVAEVPVNHFARRFGRSKYGLSRTIRVLLDLMAVKFLLDYATRPIQIFGFFGLLNLAAGLMLAGYLTYIRFFGGVALSDRPILLLAVLLIMVGVQLIILGLLGELVVRTYHETQNKTVYMVREVADAQSSPPPLRQIKP
jgi:glycosyltransferase involved in cell wall biosynthesis